MQVISLKIEPLGSVQFRFPVEFYCVVIPWKLRVLIWLFPKHVRLFMYLLYRGCFCCVNTVCFLVYVLI